MQKNINHEKSYLERINFFLNYTEDAVLIGLLLVMIVLAVNQIFLRNLFNSGVVWGDKLVRILVLWLGLVGAMIASRTNNHINIDIVSRYLPKGTKKAANSVTALFTAVVCSIVAYYSLRFVWMEFQEGGIAFASVPSWLCETIIPFAFFVIALRYFILFLINFRGMKKP